ncbi:MAG TPA: hypothetical protein VGN14_01410 [Candidatus Elarobacter sp.]|jgi:hypothetical protein
MQFEEFVGAVDAAVRTASPVDAFAGPEGKTARWTTRARNAEVAVVEPRNVSVTLDGSGKPETTWYPIDAALVPVVSRRIAAFLGEA